MSLNANDPNAVLAHLTDIGAIQRVTEDETLDGRCLTLDGERLVNFGSCSYLGLEAHPELKKGAIEATQAFGTQFSSSRSYISVTPYAELEELLEDVYGAPVVIVPSTTLGHFSAFPLMVGEKDAVVMDQQVHASVQMASQLLVARGTPVSLIRHNDMDALEAKLLELRETHEKVWYFADGVYSMYGDYAPFERLRQMLDTYPELNLYVDDAHGNTWCGDRGVGATWMELGHHPRMVLAISLNKAFAASGGALVLPNRELARTIRNIGGTMVFCGPIQPPMVGAAVASARLHASGRLIDRQLKLAGLVRRVNERLAAAGIPQMETNDTPVFFVPTGCNEAVLEMMSRIRKAGYFINMAIYPAVARKRGGLRFMANANLELEDVDGLVDCIAANYRDVVCSHGHTGSDIARLFGIPAPAILPEAI